MQKLTSLEIFLLSVNFENNCHKTVIVSIFALANIALRKAFQPK